MGPAGSRRYTGSTPEETLYTNEKNALADLGKFSGAFTIDCWWDQHDSIMFNMLLAEMVLAVLKCGKYRISPFVC